jgi:hypothetical protein
VAHRHDFDGFRGLEPDAHILTAAGSDLVVIGPKRAHCLVLSQPSRQSGHAYNSVGVEWRVSFSNIVKRSKKTSQRMRREEE